MNKLKDIIKNNTNLNENQKCDLLKLLAQNKIVEVYEDGSYKLSDEEISIREKQLKKDAEFIKSCEEKLKLSQNNKMISPRYNGDPSIDGYAFCINRSGSILRVYDPYDQYTLLPGRAIYPNECFMAYIESHGSEAWGPIYFLGPNGTMEFGYINVGQSNGLQVIPDNWKLALHGVDQFSKFVTNYTRSLPTRDSVDLYASNGNYVKSIPSGYRVIINTPILPEYGYIACGYSQKYLIAIKGYISTSGSALNVSYYANTGIRSGSMYNQIDIYPEI